MDWSRHPIPAMQLQARFGDRLVPVFNERPRSIWAMVSAAALRNPDGEALICGDCRLTWRDVVERSAQVAAGLQKTGLQRGERVALLLGNRIEFVLALFAAAQLGLVTVLLSTRQQTPEIAHVLNDCGAVMIIHESGLAGRLPGAGDVPALKYRIAVDGSAVGQNFFDLADHAPLQGHAEVGEEDTAMILYTSGTTGARRARCWRIATSFIPR